MKWISIWKKKDIYDWYTTGIQKVDRNYHLINEEILTKRDFTVLFENIETEY